MSNSNSSTYRIELSPLEADVDVSVFNAWGELVTSNKDGNLKSSLPKGLYTVRTERQGRFIDQDVRLNKDKQITLEVPGKFTSIPMPGAHTSHEYFTEAAWKCSFEFTAKLDESEKAQASSILIFFRAPNRATTRSQNLAENTELKDLKGTTLSVFADEHVRGDRQFGWKAFSTQLSPGTYLLYDGGNSNRQLQIPVLDGFQTQVYLMGYGRLLYEDIRVLTIPSSSIQRRKHQGAYDEGDHNSSTKHIDKGMAALQNNVFDVGAGLVNDFLYSKFKSPVLGLLGAYLMLLRRLKQPQKKYTSSLPEKVIRNLGRLIPGSPDVVALRILAKPWVRLDEPLRVRGVPLFRVGAEVLIRESVESPNLIPKGSLLDVVSDRIYTDTAWTSWKSISLPPKLEEMSVDESLNWVESAIADRIIYRKKSRKKLNTKDLARQVGVTPRSANNAFRSLVSKLANNSGEIEKQGVDVQRALDSIKEKVSSSLIRRAEKQISNKWPELGVLTVQPVLHANVYPVIKSVLSEYTNSPVYADTAISDIVRKTQRSEIAQTLKAGFGEKFPKAEVLDISTELPKLKTVRDVANLFVAENKITFPEDEDVIIK